MNKKNTDKSEIRIEEIAEEIQPLTLMDDIFFSTALENNVELATAILEPVFKHVLKEELDEIVEVKTQVEYKHLKQRGVRYDMFAKTRSGDYIDLEIMKGKIFSPKRNRYYSSAHDVGSLKGGEDFEKLTKFYEIIISDVDTTGRGNTSDVVKSTFESDGEDYVNGLKSVFLTTAYLDTDKTIPKELEEMLRDLSEFDIDKIKTPVIKSVHKELKEEKGAKMVGPILSQLEERDELLKKMAELDNQVNKDAIKMAEDAVTIAELRNQKNKDAIKIKELEEQVKRLKMQNN